MTTNYCGCCVVFVAVDVAYNIRTDAYDVLCFNVLSIDCFVVLFFSPKNVHNGYSV